MAMETLQPAKQPVSLLPSGGCLFPCCAFKSIMCFNAQGGFERVAAHWRGGRLWLSIGTLSRGNGVSCAPSPGAGSALPPQPYRLCYF